MTSWTDDGALDNVWDSWRTYVWDSRRTLWTLTQVRPSDLTEAVGDLGVACECVHCPPHRAATLCKCDHSAEWMLWIAHAGGDGRKTICGIAVALCDLCRRVALEWAEQYARQIGEYHGGLCCICGGKIRVTSDVITTVVAL